MIKFFIYIATLFFAFFGTAKACVVSGGFLTTELSDRKIEINHEFKGAKITIFGNSTFCKSNTIVVMEGSRVNKNVVHKIKSRTGIWLTESTTHFTNVPKIYKMAASKAPEDLLLKNVLINYGIGLKRIEFSGENGKEPSLIYEAMMALIGDMQQKGLFSESTERIRTQASLFNHSFFIPNTIYGGRIVFVTYTVATNDIVAVNIDPVEIIHVGLSAKVFELAKTRWLLYYVLSFGLSLMIGSASFILNQSRNGRRGAKSSELIIDQQVSDSLGMKSSLVAKRRYRSRRSKP